MNPQAIQQNPLDQLKDIHLPDPISLWPLGLGWWLVLVALFMIIGLLIYWIKQNQWKRTAKKKLLAMEPKADSEYYYQINRCLKQIAIQRFGQQCAFLSGVKWLDFLDSTLKRPLFNQEIPEFAQAPDNPRLTPDPNKVQKIALLWLTQHKTHTRKTLNRRTQEANV